MEQMTISKVSAQFGLSTRTLRYWEQTGCEKRNGKPLPSLFPDVII